MDKKEKFISYVVDSFLKGIEIDYHQDMTRFPHGTDFSFHQVYYDNYFPKAYFDTNSPLSEYLKGKYGINDGESLIIWDRTIQKLRKVIWDNTQDSYPAG